MTIDSSRRTALVSFGALAVGTAALAAGPSRAATTERIIPPGARELAELTERLRRAPRRRDFKTVPMILQQPDFWDNEALTEVIAYRGKHKQVWDNTNLAVQERHGSFDGQRNAHFQTKQRRTQFS